MKPHCKHILICAIAVFAAMSCSDGLDIPYSTRTHEYGSSDGSASRAETELEKRTLLLYSAGNNNLSDSLIDDINDICNGYVPYNYPYCDNLLIFSHKYDFTTPTKPCLIKVYRTRDEEVVRDTVRFWPEGTSAVDTETLAEVLSYVKDNYPSAEYGMIFSSHATGWLPEGTDLTDGEFSASTNTVPPQRSIGQDKSTQKEMDVKEFAKALPFKLHYIIFDACLTGGIEVAYELRNKCDHLIFSSEEILVDGMVYTNIVSRLLEEKPSDLQGVAQDYFNHYNNADINPYAMVSLVNCASLGKLATVCKPIFDKHKVSITGIDASKVQQLNLNDYPYRRYYFFYDFIDILEELPLTLAEKAEINSVMDECIEYKANTEYSFGYKVETFCGLSMYLPTAITDKDTRNRLNDYYLDYQWAQDTGYLAGYYSE